MSDPKDALVFYLPLGMMNENTWKGIHKSKKGPKTTNESSKPGQKKRRTMVEDDDRWYSEAALHDDVDAEGGFEKGVPRGGTSQNPVECILAAIKTRQAKMLTKRQFRRRRRGPTASAPSTTPMGAPIIDEGNAMRRAMELSRKEAADRAAAEKDPKGK
ncbi:hypothetical protein LWI28_027763 [Acer negundo]|uniref:Uncharacterized protein n=1 Tax=Acer negundo TaxID=4023 RepID=A0AAD5IHK5_ACENE|nr:hypothetical protein LWI28_027763 [Acer negundo]